LPRDRAAADEGAVCWGGAGIQLRRRILGRQSMTGALAAPSSGGTMTVAAAPADLGRAEEGQHGTLTWG
jgi:hypothetical protein